MQVLKIKFVYLKGWLSMMKNKGKCILKSILGIAAVTVIGFILFIANALFGNPISQMMANHAINKYVHENYPNLDLEVQRASYNFKNNSYMAIAHSRVSKDTRFPIYYRGREDIRSEYESYVVGRFNTVQRLEDEYSAIAKDILDQAFGYTNNRTRVMYAKEVYDKALNIVEVDEPFSKDLPLDAEISIQIGLQDYSLEAIAKVLTDAHRVFLENGYYFSMYSFYTESDGTVVMVDGVTPEAIESRELVGLLENVKHNEEINGISVFIKEGSK